MLCLSEVQFPWHLVPTVPSHGACIMLHTPLSNNCATKLEHRDPDEALKCSGVLQRSVAEDLIICALSFVGRDCVLA